MTINCVDMVEIVKHAGVKLAELRDERSEHPRAMHRFERLGDAPLGAQYLHERVADARIAAEIVVDQRQRVAHHLIGAGRQLDAMRLEIGEDGYQVQRLPCEEVGVRDVLQSLLDYDAGTNLAPGAETKQAPGFGPLDRARDQSL